jgi:hypothetical protein
VAGRLFLHELSVGATRALYQFVHAPCLEADPARLDELLGGAGFDVDDAYANQIVRERLGLGDASDFEPDDPVHRTALLPRAGIAALAWRLGLACGAARLRRLIRREDLAELQGQVSEQDWQFVMEQPGAPGAGIADLDQAPVEALPQACRRIGWNVLADACDRLPADIGARLRLKLPPAAVASNHGRPLVPWDRFASACADAGASDPHWEALWASSPSAS